MPDFHFHKKIVKPFVLSTIFTVFCALSACSSSGYVDKENAVLIQENFDLFLTEEFVSSFENEMINLHFTLKNPEEYGIEKPSKISSDITEGFTEIQKTELSETQTKLHSFEYRCLTEEQKHIYDTLDQYLNQQIALCDYPQFINLLGCASGLSSNLPLTLSEYAFYSETDITDYLSLLPQVPDLLTQAFTWEQNRTNDDCGMAGFEIDDTIEQIDRFLNDPENNLLLTSFEDRLNTLGGLSDDQRNTYVQNNKNLVETMLIPAFSQLKEDLGNLKESANEGKGLCLYENGLAYYELLLSSMTLSDRPVSTMISSLENRLEDIEDRISAVILKDSGAYSAFLAILEDTSIEEETPANMLSALEEAMKNDYPALTNVTYQVQSIPDALKSNTTAAYYLIPPFDSPEENRIYYNNSVTDKASLFMTLAHEGYPGHLYHQNYLLEQDLSPIFYVIDMTGYKEGWAFYAEINAMDYYDFGEYDSAYHDSLVELYRCNIEYSYCLSSLVDLYVNAKGYTEEQIQSFLFSFGMEEETAISLYEFAIEEPGTYLQYYIGYLEILSIRQKFEDKSGKNFSELEFHTAFLDLGPCYYTNLLKYMSKKY